jgi:S1-C subfamily serine protease
MASGFLYGEFHRVVQPNDKEYRIFLATNRHVFENEEVLYLRFNPGEGEQAREYPLTLKNGEGQPSWFTHVDPEVDVAVIPINAGMLKNDGIQFAYFLSDEHVATREKVLELGITEGDFVYTLGFPLGLVGGGRNFVVVRAGVIARIRDALAGRSSEFLIDTSIFPGNSGGPVVTKPEIASVRGTKAVSRAYLIGMVSGYVPYQDVAISVQTDRPRVIFEENSGLASVVPIDFVNEVIHSAVEAEKGK